VYISAAKQTRTTSNPPNAQQPVPAVFAKRFVKQAVTGRARDFHHRQYTKITALVLPANLLTAAPINIKTEKPIV
jgi:hypothetical protein